MRKFAAVAIVSAALCLAVLIHDLGPAVNFNPQVAVTTQPSPQLSPSVPATDQVGQP